MNSLHVFLYYVWVHSAKLSAEALRVSDILYITH